jgi:hypothetical protein
MLTMKFHHEKVDFHGLHLHSATSKPRPELVMGHDVVRRQQSLLGEDHDPPLQPGPAFEEILV